MPQEKKGVFMITFIGMVHLILVVNSTNKKLSLTESSGLRFCDVDRFNAKSVK